MFVARASTDEACLAHRRVSNEDALYKFLVWLLVIHVVAITETAYSRTLCG